MSDRPVVVWFRDDLRLDDNPALTAAMESGRPVVALHVLDDETAGLRPIGAAARWWLHHSLDRLTRSLDELGVPLVLRRGPARETVADVAARTGASEVVWNRRYHPSQVAIDRDLKASLRGNGLAVRSFQACVLFEPNAVATGGGTPYRVFTPFWRSRLAAPAPRLPLPRPRPNRAARFDGALDGERLDDLALRPSGPDWSQGLANAWTPGEDGAHDRLREFLETGLSTYDHDRDRPDLDGVSRLSAHLRFGEISPFRVWWAVRDAMARDEVPERSADKFLAEIGWREFAHHLMFHFPDMATHGFQPRFDAFPWREDAAFETAWRRGLTGYPLVDAGLRQLWTTGWMHNRVRMVAASFLVKHGLVDWRAGERWFWDTLVDACPANNPAGWQWVAGCGADAAPYFRVFNPIGQGTKFDPDGAHVRRWVPEIAALPTRVIHAPWTADAATLAAAGIRLGETYPLPIVDHARARARALAAYAATTTTR